MGYSPRGSKESDVTERLHLHLHFHPRKLLGNPSGTNILMEESRVCPRHELGPQKCTVVSKNPASEVREAWCPILALLLAGWVTLEKSLNLSGPHFLHL